jgi:lipid A 3-O-deacylase
MVFEVNERIALPYLISTRQGIVCSLALRGNLVKGFFAALLAIGFCNVLVTPAAQAQAGPTSGGHELQVWTGGGHALNGNTSDTGVWNLGARYGWVLTDPVGSGPLRGRFEYAVDVVPVFLLTQQTGTAYGFGLNPVVLKWNCAGRREATPYVELGGGILFSNTQVPPGTSQVNFTTSAALGLHFPRGKYNWSAEVRFMHISNAGLATPNPGINTIQVRLGFGRFTQPK